MKPSRRFPYPGQYAGSCHGQVDGPRLWTIWKIGGIPLMIYESVSKAERDLVLAELERADQ